MPPNFGLANRNEVQMKLHNSRKMLFFFFLVLTAAFALMGKFCATVESATAAWLLYKYNYNILSTTLALAISFSLPIQFFL